MKYYVQTHFWKEHLCALQVLLFALVSRRARARTRAQLRGNIGSEVDVSQRGYGLESPPSCEIISRPPAQLRYITLHTIILQQACIVEVYRSPYTNPVKAMAWSKFGSSACFS